MRGVPLLDEMLQKIKEALDTTKLFRTTHLLGHFYRYFYRTFRPELFIKVEWGQLHIFCHLYKGKQLCDFLFASL